MMLYGDGPATDTATDVEEVDLPAGPDAARVVRDTLMRALDSWGWAHRSDDATLCASDLVSVVLDAGYHDLHLVVCHLSDRISVEIRCRRGECRFADVLSQGDGGRSITVVDDLATVWGVRPTGDGDAVWFELR